MPPGGELRYFADESILGLAKGLAALRSDLVHPGHHRFPGVQLGDLDPDWIPLVARRGLVAIGPDKRIRTRERRELAEHGLRYVWIGGKQDETSWQWARRLLRHWDTIESRIASEGDGPWSITLLANGLATDTWRPRAQ